jgi:hypothetical protein
MVNTFCVVVDPSDAEMRRVTLAFPDSFFTLRKFPLNLKASVCDDGDAD